jgi:hypothetical protein
MEEDVKQYSHKLAPRVVSAFAPVSVGGWIGGSGMEEVTQFIEASLAPSRSGCRAAPNAPPAAMARDLAEPEGEIHQTPSFALALAGANADRTDREVGA